MFYNAPREAVKTSLQKARSRSVEWVEVLEHLTTEKDNEGIATRFPVILDPCSSTS